MKPFLIVVLLISILTTVYSQDRLGYSVTNDDPHPKSPEAEGLLKSISFPVDKHSGTINISIPIHTLRVNGFSLPISLDYNTSGIKVTQMASCVGLGWVLNPGGMISRSAKGAYLDDDALGGYLKHSDAKNKDNQEEIYKVFDPTTYSADYPDWDMEPDWYSYKCGNISGSFTYNRTGEVVQIPEKDVIISYDLSNSKIKDWKVTSLDGMQYFFKEEDKSSSMKLVGYDMVASQKETYAWLIDKIVTPKHDTISFYYEEEVDYIREKVYAQEKLFMNEGNFICQNGSEYFSYTWAHRLSRIESRNEKVEFVYNTVIREDINQSYKAYGLKEINIYEKDNELVPVKQYSLLTSYFEANPDRSIYDGISDYSFKRLRLDEVKVQPLNSETYSYKFAYNKHNIVQGTNGCSGFPPRMSHAMDHWGYYNGKDENVTSIPSFNRRKLAGPTMYAAADKRPDSNFKKAFILDEVTYPTGGKAKFFYESDFASYTQYNEDIQEEETGEFPAGGLVVKKVIYDPIEGEELVEEYEYEVGYLLHGSPIYHSDCQGSPLYSISNMGIFWTTVDIFGDMDANADIIYYSSPINATHSGVSNLVMHQSVKIIQPNSGYVEYSYNRDVQYDMYDPEDMNNDIKPYLNIGQPVSIKYFNQRGDLLKEVHNKYNTYFKLITNRDSYDLVHHHYSYQRIHYGSYSMYTGFSFLKKTIEKEYNGNDCLQSETINNYSHLNFNYDNDGYAFLQPNETTPIHHALTSKQTIGTGGKELNMNVLYVVDIPESERSPIQQMMVDSAMLVAPIEYVTTIKEDELTKVKDAQYLMYDNFDGYIGLKEAYAYKGQKPINNEEYYPSVVFSGGQYQINSTVLESKSQVKYNGYGLLIEQSKTADTPTTFIYDSKMANPIYLIKNSTIEEVAYTGFEGVDFENWIEGDLTINSSYASFNTTSSSFRSSELPAGKYIVQFNAWLDSEPVGNESILVNEVSVDVKSRISTTYNVPIELNATERVSFTNMVNSKIYFGKILIYPNDAQVFSYEYLTGIGLTKETDLNGNSTSYDYDDFGRLKTVKDKNGNILKGYKYKYITE